MTAAHVGMAVGAVLGLTWAAFGFGWFVLVALAIAIGFVVGRVIDGRLDLTPLADVIGGRRRSS